MAIHSNILAWKIPWSKEPVATVHGVAKSQTRLSTAQHSPEGVWGVESRVTPLTQYV